MHAKPTPARGVDHEGTVWKRKSVMLSVNRLCGKNNAHRISVA